MILPNINKNNTNSEKIIARVQNLCISCPGDDEQYHSDIHAYDYIISALDIAKRSIQQEIDKIEFNGSYLVNFKLKRKLHLICYINSDLKRNPYFLIYDLEKEELRMIASVNELSIFKINSVRENIPYRIHDTLFYKNTMILNFDKVVDKINSYDKFMDEQK